MDIMLLILCVLAGQGGAFAINNMFEKAFHIHTLRIFGPEFYAKWKRKKEKK
jgi:hypothetical protein